MNIEFEYLYRDGGNNKNFGGVVFTNDSQLSIGDLEAEIRNHLEMGELFIADQVGVPEVFLWDPDANYDPDDASTYPADLGPGKYAIWEDMDGCYHEFDCLSVTDKQPTDNRTITRFVADLAKANREGWRVFLPTDRRAAV